MTDPRSAWSTFVAWHRTEKLWQDIYTRAVSALIVAAAIYVFAVLSGYVRVHPSVIGSASFLVLGIFAGKKLPGFLLRHPKIIKVLKFFALVSPVVGVFYWLVPLIFH
ncbi:hypothetical protein M6D93_05685 [Jatrophihabitans telluris]|uniref:Uncharacterized protein n=1 Tax=Jatrophihabitans telluris TaxID=2038343 RepID=A0ABY4R167_9ACTN|nr:hypothetical protein [Jatrophihabitans telluris]UQX89498.1 hypothetical protein M6D93_05685 [Jatrophihabitans telluris]